ncbi:hypothetical protein D3C76_1252830 [compost metagenome]
MVINHVHDDVHTQLLFDGLHHGTKLFDAGSAFGIGSVRTFRHRVVERVITPVIGVSLCHIAIQFLHLRVVLAVILFQFF